MVSSKYFPATARAKHEQFNRLIADLLLLVPLLLPLLLLLFSGKAWASPQYDYLLHCSGCHLENGAGSPPDVPDLRLSMEYLLGSPEGRSYLIRVPGASQAPISDKQLADVMNWMLKTYAPKKAAEVSLYDEAEIARSRKNPLLNAVLLREQLMSKQ